MGNNNLKNLTGAERYAYFIKEIITHKEVWLLKAHDGLYAMVEDNNNQTYLTVWPDATMVQDFVTGDWEEYIPERMGLAEFLDWMQELKDDGILIGVFPDAAMQSMAVDPMELKKLLIQESKG
jgi:hypothetical protein